MFAKKSISCLFSVLFVVVLMPAVTPLQVAHAAGECYVKSDAGGSNVGTSWTDAYTDLQSALGASPCTEIWVAAGTYKPTAGTSRDATFQLKNGVALYGGFAGTETARTQRDPAVNATTLSGDIGAAGNSDNSYHVVTGATGATLDGFTITAGNANGIYPYNYGGGMYNESSNPTLTNVTFSGNTTTRSGGGLSNYLSSPMLSDVTFNDNTANYGGGGMFNSTSNPTLTNVTFSGNFTTNYGGGMYNAFSSPTLTNVTFSGNTVTEQGGGMYNYNISNPTLTNVNFSGNTARTYGGGIYNDNSSSPTLTNVTFSGNTANTGGGMYNYNKSSPTLTNVTFNGNSVTAYGGGMYNDASSPTLTNVTFNNNSSSSHGGGMYNESSSSPSLMNATFSDNTAKYGGGMNNYNSSPTLTNVTFNGNAATNFGGGLRNQSGSPTLTNVTFSGNTTTGSGGGMYNDESSNPQIRNTIFWGNTATTAGAEIYNDGVSTSVVDDSVVQGGYAGGSNIIINDPKLGALGSYGGYTQTISLLPGSSAINAGNNTTCATTDQRGITRPQPAGGKCDIGAYEYVDVSAPFVTSITRLNPSPTNLASVDFTVTFSEAVSGVGTSDFALTASGVSGTTVSGFSGSGSVYTVTVNTGTGNGTIRLDVPISATVTDLAGIPLAGLPYTSGETYTVEKLCWIYLPLIRR
jgi:predicted outer membrane repeat protein